MPQHASIVDLARLSLSFGEAASVAVPVKPLPLRLGGQSYAPQPEVVESRVDVSRTNAGYAMRLRFELRLAGPCHRCLDDATIDIDVDAREVEQPRAQDEELRSPYVEREELDVGGWAHDAIALALPAQLLCRSDCAGLCSVCGELLNDADPDAHQHQQGGDPRWAKLRELRID